MQKNVTNTFNHNNFYTQILIFLFNFPKNKHVKFSDELLQASVGHLSPDLHQFQCKINFCKIFNFVENFLHTLLTIATFTLKVSHFCLICQKKIRHFKLSDELLQASVGHLSPDLHQFQCKIDFFSKSSILSKTFVQMEYRICKANGNCLDSLLKHQKLFNQLYQSISIQIYPLNSVIFIFTMVVSFFLHHPLSVNLFYLWHKMKSINKKSITFV